MSPPASASRTLNIAGVSGVCALDIRFPLGERPCVAGHYIEINYSVRRQSCQKRTKIDLS